MPTETAPTGTPAPPKPNAVPVMQWAITVTICLLAVAYTIAVVLGSIPKERKIDGTNLLILALAGIVAILLVKPDALERLKKLKLAGFELEMEKLKRKQDQQQSQLEAISLLLPLVLRDEEAKHLLNLATKQTAHYMGSHAVRSELRRLATMGLIERLPGRMMREMSDGLTFDLAQYAQLKPFGRRIVSQLEEIEKTKADKEVYGEPLQQ